MQLLKASIAASLLSVLVCTTTHSQIAGDRVKLGVLSDFSGPYSSWGGNGSVIATEMAVEDFKKAHPEASYKIEIVSADFQLKADLAVSIARKWVDEGVNAIIDIPHSPSALAVNAALRGSATALLVSGSAHNDLTTRDCSPNTVHWTYDQAAIGKPTTVAMSEGGKSWFFVTVNAAGGKALEDSSREIILANGGKVVGSVRTPPNNPDFASQLLQAQASKADVVAILQGGSDTINAVKQAQEFGIPNGGQKLVLLWALITDIHGMGLKVAQDLVFTEAFYWDTDDNTRSFSKRFSERFDGKVPTSVQAGTYSVVTHYLKAVNAAKSSFGPAVIAKMKQLPVADQAFGSSTLREDGRLLHDLYLVQVKTPSESREPWDYYKILRKVPGSEAFRPPSKDCILVN
jgi:branched-chain amino acid transport system substrate-binding protein